MSSPWIERDSRFGAFYDAHRNSPVSDEYVDAWLGAANGNVFSTRKSADQDLLNFYRNFEHCVLFEDSSVLVLNKPTGVVSHWSLTTPIGVQELAQYLKGQDIAYVHRLDRPTSGVLLLAKSREAFLRLAPQFAHQGTHSSQKKYLTILEGEMVPSRPFTAEVPLMPNGATKMKVAKGISNGQTVLSSLTHFRPMVVLEREDGSKRTLVEVQIYTGRTHQIRVVCAQYLGLPVVGDYLYDPKYDRSATRLMLHAHSLAFNHPVSNERMTVKAPVPEDFFALIKG